MKKLQGKASLKRLGEKITVVVSDETLDRHGEVLHIENWDLSRFRLAPRMLVDHDHRVEKIVGKWENVRVEGKELLAEPVFHDFTDLAKAVQDMVNEEYLNTVSVGFIPHSPEEDGGHEKFELIEISWVTVPANHNARILKAMEKEVTVEAKKEIAKFTGKEDQIIDFTPEGMEKMGFEVVKDLEHFKKWKESFGGSEKVSVICLSETQFIEKLVEENEKQKTLIDTHDEELKKVVASNKDHNKKMLRIALKEVAKTVNHALRHANGK